MFKLEPIGNWHKPIGTNWQLAQTNWNQLAIGTNQLEPIGNWHKPIGTNWQLAQTNWNQQEIKFSNWTFCFLYPTGIFTNNLQLDNSNWQLGLGLPPIWKLFLLHNQLIPIQLNWFPTDTPIGQQNFFQSET